MTDIPIPGQDNDDSKQAGYILPRHTDAVSPLSTDHGNNAAADLIRQKLAKIYAEEPNAQVEEKEAEAEAPQVRSKHQQFIYDLNHSGKDLAQIQIDWHNYYQALPDNEKHQVWQEFYDSRRLTSAAPTQPTPAGPTESDKLIVARNELVGHNLTAKEQAKAAKRAQRDARTPTQLQKTIRKHVSTSRKVAKNKHVQSLIFGLGMGFLAVAVFLFGFFNEVIIAPFIQPSRTQTATPIIVTASSIAPTDQPEVIIPKINVEIPVNYTETSTDEAVIENDLQSGIVHYPTTSMPGQNGNAAFFGHSSNNIFNQGKYKFAFVLLHELVPGDTFYLTKDGKLYTYRVFSKTIVSPTDVGVLDPVAGHIATATLITCDPPGTSLNRLIVVGDQISPDVSTNTTGAPSTTVASASATQLAGNGPTLWGRFISQGIGKTVVAAVALAAVLIVARRISRRNRAKTTTLRW